MRRMTLWRRGVTAHQPRGWQLTLAFRRLHSTSGSSGPGLTPRALNERPPNEGHRLWRWSFTRARARCSERLAALSSPGGRRRRAIAMILVINGGVSL